MALMTLANPAQRIGMSLSSRARSKPVRMFAGGQVRGPGTATSDSIPAMLSAGEEVLPADTVNAVGRPKLAALIAATHKQVPQRPSLAQTARLANGGSTDPWAKQYAPGGSLYVAPQTPVSTAPVSSDPAQPLTSAVSAAQTFTPAKPTNTIATSNVQFTDPATGATSGSPGAPSGSYVSGMKPDDSRVGTWNASVDAMKTNKATGYPTLANGGAVKRPSLTNIARAYANGGPVKRAPLGVHLANGGSPYYDEAGQIVAPDEENPHKSEVVPNAMGGFTYGQRPLAAAATTDAAPTPWPMPSREALPNIGDATKPLATTPDLSPPGTITRTGNSFSGSREQNNQPPGMTTEDANRYYGAINAQNRANDAQNDETRQNNMVRAGQAAQDNYDARNAAWAAKVDAGSIVNGMRKNPLSAGSVAQAGLSADRARSLTDVARASRAAVDNAAAPNYAQQATNVQNAGDQAQRASFSEQQGRMSLAQMAQMNPLNVEETQQKVGLGRFSLAQHATIQDLRNRMLKETDPAKLAQQESMLNSMTTGKPYSAVNVHTIGGGVDPQTMAALPQHALVVDSRTGQSFVVDKQGKSTPVGQGAPGAKSSIPPQAAIDELSKNNSPRLRALFDEKYGEGSSDRFLAK